MTNRAFPVCGKRRISLSQSRPSIHRDLVPPRPVAQNFQMDGLSFAIANRAVPSVFQATTNVPCRASGCSSISLSLMEAGCRKPLALRLSCGRAATSQGSRKCPLPCCANCRFMAALGPPIARSFCDPVTLSVLIDLIERQSAGLPADRDPPRCMDVSLRLFSRPMAERH